MFDIIFIDVREIVTQAIFGDHLGPIPYTNARNEKLKNHHWVISNGLLAHLTTQTFCTRDVI